jgi:hypothetical protein
MYRSSCLLNAFSTNFEVELAARDLHRVSVGSNAAHKHLRCGSKSAVRPSSNSWPRRWSSTSCRTPSCGCAGTAACWRCETTPRRVLAWADWTWTSPYHLRLGLWSSLSGQQRWVWPQHEVLFGSCITYKGSHVVPRGEVLDLSGDIHHEVVALSGHQLLLEIFRF